VGRRHDPFPGEVPVRKPSISPRIRRWLETEVAVWRGEGLVSTDQARAILGRYGSPEEAARRRGRLLFFVLTGMALLMFAAGVLLLIGHNWEALSRATKVVLLLAAVAASFTGSAVGYLRGRPVAGELLAFAGTLLYGNAIWLLAQVFHIQAHYPDGVYWWMIGALLAAHALRSVLIGAEAATLLTVWAGMESGGFGDPVYHYWIWAALVLWLALRLRSGLLAVTGGLSATFWILTTAAGAWDTFDYSFALTLLAGCALWTAGSLVRGIPPVARGWQITGIGALLVSLIPLTFVEYHEGIVSLRSRADYAETLTAGILMLAFVAVGSLLSRRRDERISLPVLLTAAAAILPLLLRQELRAGWELESQMAFALLFSGISVLVSIWLIHRGIALDRAESFFTGVLYLLIFALVRWVDLIGDMVSSAAVFFISALILYGTARYWQGRRATKAAAGEATHE
jgi:uncharacterized membrane protein